MNAEEALRHITDECRTSGWPVDANLHAEVSGALRGLSTYARLLGEQEHSYTEWLNRVVVLRNQIEHERNAVRPVLEDLLRRLPHTEWGDAVHNIIHLHLYKIAAAGLPQSLDLVVFLMAENRMEQVVFLHAQGYCQRYEDNRRVRADVLEYMGPLVAVIAAEARGDEGAIGEECRRAIEALG